MLKIEHLSKFYGDKKAVDDLSLHIEKGHIYGFIGHNGAGKTTTLKSIAGISNTPTAFKYRSSSVSTGVPTVLLKSVIISFLLLSL